MDIEGILAIICAVGLPIGGGLYLAFKVNQSKHAEKMAMIERGLVEEDKPKPKNTGEMLKRGLLMIGLAIGGLLGFWVAESFYTRQSYWLIIGLFMMLFGGIATAVSYIILSHKNKN